MTQRFYATNQSTNTNRPIRMIEMPSLGIGNFQSTSRAAQNQQILRQMEDSLIRSMSRQSGQMMSTGNNNNNNKKNISSSSRGSLHGQPGNQPAAINAQMIKMNLGNNNFKQNSIEHASNEHHSSKSAKSNKNINIMIKNNSNNLNSNNNYHGNSNKSIQNVQKIQDINRKVLKQYQENQNQRMRGRQRDNNGNMNNNNNNNDKNKQQQLDSNVILLKFQFKILAYIVQVFLAYGITIGLMYLIKVSNFPFFLVLYIFGLMFSISPWSKTNALLPLICLPIIIANFFLNIQILTYPSILLCYFSILIFNQHHKSKLLYIPTLILTILWGFLIIPAVYTSFIKFNNAKGFYYIFPLFMVIIRSFLYLMYRKIKYTQYIYLQLPFFLLGIQYGIIMTLKIGDIQFWYLMVFFTLSIINDRTQFMIDVLWKLGRALTKLQGIQRKKSRKNVQSSSIRNQNQSIQNLADKDQPQQGQPSQNISVLSNHTSGYNSLHSLHIICIVYVFTMLPIYSPPYLSTTSYSIYLNNQIYLPLIIWSLALVYQIMCLVLQRKRPDKMLIGFTHNTVVHCIGRGFVLAVGLWMFYLGLGVGSQAIYAITTTTV